MLSAHSDRLERWFGPAEIARISLSMAGDRTLPKWYGPPIAVGNVPGSKIYATSDGDFIGRMHSGKYASLFDAQLERLVHRYRRWERRQLRGTMLNAGFSSLSDLISEATAGAKTRMFPFQKTGPTGVVGSCHTLWRVGAWPPVGTVGTAAPGGVAETSSTTGAFPFSNPASGDTQHFVTGWITSSAASTLLLYDRLFSVAKTINSTANEAVSGVPTRYQSTTATNADYIGGNFLSMQVTATAYANTAHNWDTSNLYTNQAGTASQALPSLAGNPGSAGTIADRLDMPNGTWFAPLNAADTGVKAITQMHCSALVATGSLDFVIGHPIAWLPSPLVNTGVIIDGINTAFNLVRIFDSANLSFLEIQRSGTTAVTYAGQFMTVAG